MAKLIDFEFGTAFIYLFREDFKSEERYKSYARFMMQDPNCGCVYVPIDAERAKKRMEVQT